MRIGRALDGFHAHGLIIFNDDGAGIVNLGFLLRFQPAERQRNVHGHAADTGAVQRGVGLADAHRFDEQAVVVFFAGQGQVAAAAEHGPVQALVQRKAHVHVHSRAARAAGNAQDGGARIVRSQNGQAGSGAVAAQLHNGFVGAADISRVDAGTHGHAAHGDGGGEHVGHAGHLGGHVHGPGQGDGHPAHGGHVLDEVQADGHDAVHSRRAAADGDAGHVHVAVGNRRNGQAGGVDAAAALGFPFGGADVGFGVQAVDGHGRHGVHSHRAHGDGDRHGNGVAGETVAHGHVRVLRVDGHVPADDAARFAAVEGQHYAGVHRRRARRDGSGNDGGVGAAGGLHVDGIGYVLNGLRLAARDHGVGFAVEVSHTDGGVHAHGPGRRR